MPDSPFTRPPRSTDADRALLAASLIAVGNGDRTALHQVYLYTSAKLFGICLRILSDRHHAEEALQETFLTIWRRADAFDPDRGSAITWLMTIARNAAIDRRRTVVRAALEPLPDGFDPVDPADDALAKTIALDENRRLHGCMDRLAIAERGFIAAAFFEGSSYSELAERAAMPLPTVKSRIRRALLKLRECLA